MSTEKSENQKELEKLEGQVYKINRYNETASGDDKMEVPELVAKRIKYLKKQIYLDTFEPTNQEFQLEFAKIKMLSKLPEGNYRCDLEKYVKDGKPTLKISFRPVIATKE